MEVSAAKTGVAGVVVLYHPDAGVADRIDTYLGQIDFLVAVDNSPAADASLQARLEASGKASYAWDGRNRGMAEALNMGAARAADLGCRWLLTMDQDSAFSEGAVPELLRVGASRERVGIVSPRHDLRGKEASAGASLQEGGGEAGSGAVEEVGAVMTSGNLLSLEAYRAAGPFLEKLFIDYVDYEYCLRLRKAGYRILVARRAGLRHSLGRITPQRFLAWTAHPTHHDPVRRYYMTRNRLFVMRENPSFIVPELWAWGKEMGKLFLFERERMRKLRLMARGALDFLNGRYGPLDRSG